MSICPVCNDNIQDSSARFCPSCGTPVSSKNMRKAPWIIAGAVICLVLITGVVFRDKLGLIFPFLRSGTAFAATLAPENTELFFVIDPDMTQLKNYERIKDIYLAVPEVKEAFDDLQDNVKGDSYADIDFGQDVKPWLGSEAALIMPDAFSSGSEPEYLLAVAVKDKKKAKEFVVKLRQKEENSGGIFKEENYKEVLITTEDRSSMSNKKFVYALVKDHLILSNSKALVAQAIDKYKDKGESLARNESYEEIMSKLPKSRSGAFYMDFDAIMGAAEKAGLENFDQLRAYKGIGMSLSFVEEGVRIDYSVAYDRNKVSQSSGDNAKGAVGLKNATEIIPADAMAYVGISNLKQGLEDFVSSVKTQPGYRGELSDFKRETGLDPESDILSWMDGVLAIGFLPDRSGLFGEKNAPFGIIALIGTNDLKTTANSMKTLANSLVRLGAGKNDKTYNNQEVHYLFERRTGKVVAGYGIRDNFLVIGSSIDMLEKGMGTNNDRIGRNASFKKATAGLPSIQDGCIYVDVEEMTNSIYNSLDSYNRQEFNRSVYPYLKPVKTVSLGVEGANGGDHFNTGAVLIRIDR
ncbi:MAG: hypothetical protein A4E55_02419 [Pelotomaculum sp. PtaU1.Bin035]|nr:MAG: hypothetical protein A4E55_02419 [Pelotomaculum sp. PtaU1.Bin035]